MSEDYEYVKINKHIDTMPYFGNWEVTTIIVFVTVMTVFIMISNSFVSQMFGIVGGLIASKIHIKLKENSVKGFLKHLAYRLGIFKTTTLIPSHLRHFKGA